MDNFSVKQPWKRRGIYNQVGHTFSQVFIGRFIQVVQRSLIILIIKWPNSPRQCKYIVALERSTVLRCRWGRCPLGYPTTQSCFCSFCSFFFSFTIEHLTFDRHLTFVWYLTFHILIFGLSCAVWKWSVLHLFISLSFSSLSPISPNQFSTQSDHYNRVISQDLQLFDHLLHLWLSAQASDHPFDLVTSAPLSNGAPGDYLSDTRHRLRSAHLVLPKSQGIGQI